MKVEIENVEVELDVADALAVLESRIAQLTERVQELEWSSRRKSEELESTRNRVRKVEEHTGLRKNGVPVKYLQGDSEPELVVAGS